MPRGGVSKTGTPYGAECAKRVAFYSHNAALFAHSAGRVGGTGVGQLRIQISSVSAVAKPVHAAYGTWAAAPIGSC